MAVLVVQVLRQALLDQASVVQVAAEVARVVPPVLPPVAAALAAWVATTLVSRDPPTLVAVAEVAVQTAKVVATVALES